MKKPTFKERFMYWFDNKMSKGSLALINILAFATVISVVILSLVLLIFKLNEDTLPLASVWDLLATVINAEVPYSDAGGIGMIAITFVAALIGLLITSVLIGIISSAIEEKVNALKTGSSSVLESGHTVILGFTPGEYTLIEQLILSAAGEKKCILVAGELPQDEIFQHISENIEIPKNINLICRTVDLTNPKSLEKCSLPMSRSIIVSPTDDLSTIKQVLASATIVDTANSKAQIAALLSKKENGFPESLARKHNITAFNTKKILAKIIAHSCTQTGLSEVFTEVFNFEGCELYAKELPHTVGKTFGDLMHSIDWAVPVGLINGQGANINPCSDVVVNEGDKVLFFAETKDSPVVSDVKEVIGLPEYPTVFDSASDERIVIIGSNDALSTIISELPERTLCVTLADFDSKYSEDLNEVLSLRPDISVEYYKKDLTVKENLLRLVRAAEHVIIVGDYDENEDAADMKSIFYVLNLRDIRERNSLSFTITVEMCKDANKRLAYNSDDTDFIVSKNMLSLILAQLAESADLYDVFQELLSNDGNEIYIKAAKNYGCYGERTISEIRDIVLNHHGIFLGYKKQSEHRHVFNPRLDEKVTLAPDDRLVVICEN